MQLPLGICNYLLAYAITSWDMQLPLGICNYHLGYAITFWDMLLLILMIFHRFMLYLEEKLSLDYGDVIFHNSRTYLMDLIEQVQYKAALVVSVCWQGTRRVKLYNELGWESLPDQKWFRRLTYFYKIVNRHTPDYLYKHIPPQREI